MYGAIIGDIVGSRFEWKNTNSTDFDLFTKDSKFTDDTVMTIAVADALLKTFNSNYELHQFDNVFKHNLIEKMKYWGKKYPNAGYGGMFRGWLQGATNYEPYNSFGNGSAMRVSPVAYYVNDIEEVRKIAKLSAEVTHNHPEGIKGAECIASAIYLSRDNSIREKCSKEYIKQYIEEEFGYNLDITTEEYRKPHKFDATCQGTVPQAVRCFLEGEDFEEVIRLAISLGGDSDTIAAMAGSIAEAYYEIPTNMVRQIYKRLPKEMILVIKEFNIFR